MQGVGSQASPCVAKAMVPGYLRFVVPCFTGEGPEVLGEEWTVGLPAARPTCVLPPGFEPPGGRLLAFAVPLRLSLMPVTPGRCAMGASSALVRNWPSCPPAEKPGGPIVTVLPTELSAVEAFSLTARCATSITMARPVTSPRIAAIETVRVTLRNALRMPRPRMLIACSPLRRQQVPWAWLGLTGRFGSWRHSYAADAFRNLTAGPPPFPGQLAWRPGGVLQGS